MRPSEWVGKFICLFYQFLFSANQKIIYYMFLTQRNTLGRTQQNHMFGSAPAFAVSMDFNSREILNEMFYHYLTTTLSSSSSSTSSTFTSTTTVSAILKQLYDTYCPAKVSSIPSIVTKYKGNETILFQKLWKKYQIPPAWLAYVPSSFSVENEINASEILSTETESVKIISHILSNIIDELINKTSETRHDDIAATTNLFSPPEALEQEVQLVFRTKEMKPVKLNLFERDDGNKLWTFTSVEYQHQGQVSQEELRYADMQQRLTAAAAAAAASPLLSTIAPATVICCDGANEKNHFEELQVSERLENIDYADGNVNECGGDDADADGEEVKEVLQYIERDNCIWKVVRLNGRQWIELAVEMTDDVVDESNRGGFSFGGGVINRGNKTLKSEHGFGFGFGQRNMYDHDVESVVDTEANSRPAAGGFRFG